MHAVELLFHFLLLCVGLLLSLVNPRHHQHRINFVRRFAVVHMQLGRVELVDVLGFAALLHAQFLLFAFHDRFRNPILTRLIRVLISFILRLRSLLHVPSLPLLCSPDHLPLNDPLRAFLRILNRLFMVQISQVLFFFFFLGLPLVFGFEGGDFCLSPFFFRLDTLAVVDGWAYLAKCLCFLTEEWLVLEG